MRVASMEKYNMLFSPMSIGNVEIKNRVVMAPMCMGFGQFNGKATDTMIDYYVERAKGGVGLIFTEITRVNDMTGASSFGQLALSHDYQIEPLKKMVDKVHSYGTKIMVELHHPGRQNLGLMIGTVPLSAACDKIMGKAYAKLLTGAVIPPGKKLQDKDIVPRVIAPSKCEKSKMSESVNRGITKTGIKRLQKQFVEGAVRVKKAGCDGVELHAAHGYLIQQFLSPNTNKRNDEYGGSLENRMRFLLEIIDGIRNACGNDFPIVVRLSVDEMYEKIGQKGKGYDLQEGLKMAKILNDKGIDAIDVSSAAYDTFNYWLEPTTFTPGWRKYLAQEVKKVVDIPVIAANMIRSPEQAEKQLQDGIQDFVSLGRPLIADPHWVEKVMNGEEKLIKRCVCCLYCFESMMHNAYKYTHGNCSVNPLVGREGEAFNNNGNGRRVAIVGAGVAGLTAAELLAKRGFNVSIYEKAAEVGGQINLAKMPPNKEKIAWCVQDLKANVQNLGVTINYKDLLDEIKPEIVICATGANAISPKAFSGDNVCTVTQILSGEVRLENRRVAVIGSGMTGLETSELLVKQGNRVTIIEMANEIAPGAWFQQVDDVMPKLKVANTVFMPSHKLLEIHNDCVIIENTKTKSKVNVEVDNVVLSLGCKPDNDLYNQIKNSDSYKVYNIGDSVKVGRIANATESAYQVVKSIE
jgi:2,4-dienoyl-CoA reductase-like NADH-dependent reductase (Old Yellow Enzyme family)/thioredoxin reductase